MKNILIDTNIILDIALQRDPFFNVASVIFSLIDKKKIKGYITASSVTDIYYVLKKQVRNDIAKDFIADLIEVIDVINVDKNIIVEAILLKMKDFEDAIQVSAAKNNKIRIIVTRNKQDFHDSDLEVYTPEELVSMFS
jgi:predicted nucleic acid-binding protein